MFSSPRVTTPRIAGLQAEHRLAWQVEQCPIEGTRHRAAAIDAIIGLMELIAESRVGGEPSEVVEEIERVFDHIGIRFPHSVIVGVCEPGRQHETAGVAAIGRVDLAEKTNLSGRNGAQRYLIAGVPAVCIRHRRSRNPVRRSTLTVTQCPVPIAAILSSETKWKLRSPVARNSS
jgi:hypothetical protein